MNADNLHGWMIQCIKTWCKNIRILAVFQVEIDENKLPVSCLQQSSIVTKLKYRFIFTYDKCNKLILNQKRQKRVYILNFLMKYDMVTSTQ